MSRSVHALDCPILNLIEKEIQSLGKDLPFRINQLFTKGFLYTHLQLKLLTKHTNKYDEKCQVKSAFWFAKFQMHFHD